MSLNAHYMVLFKNPRDVSNFANLARQMCPKTSQFAVEAYRNATREPYTYLLVDLRPEQDEELRHFSRRDSLRIRSKDIKRGAFVDKFSVRWGIEQR